jgi:hypothetical protein
MLYLIFSIKQKKDLLTNDKSILMLNKREKNVLIFIVINNVLFALQPILNRG